MSDVDGAPLDFDVTLVWRRFISGEIGLLPEFYDCIVITEFIFNGGGGPVIVLDFLGFSFDDLLLLVRLFS